MIALYQRLEILLWRCIAIQAKAVTKDHQHVQRVMQRCVEMLGDARGQKITKTWKDYIGASTQLLNQSTPHFVNSVSAMIPHAEILRNFLEHNIFQPWSENGNLMGCVSLKSTIFFNKITF